MNTPAEERRLEHYRELLQKRERELSDLMQRRTRTEPDAREGELSIARPSYSPDDAAIEDELKDDALAQVQVHDRELAQVQAALARIDDGSYGECLDCGEPIPTERLEVEPQALRCIDCQEDFERRSSEQAQVPTHRTM